MEVKAGSGRSVHDFIRDAHGHGARFWACSNNLGLFDITKDELIPECSGMMSTTRMIIDLMDGTCRVLAY